MDIDGTITAIDAIDVRFPTSRALDGSDAMNPDPDYSATYVVVRTDLPDGPEGHGLTFTIGRGNELCVAAVEALAPLLLGASLAETFTDMGGMWRSARFDVPVWPHAGGVGLCEYVQHLSIIDALCISGRVDGRRIEYVDHLHEHFLDPVVVRDGAYRVPTTPGYSAEMYPASLRDHRFPEGAVWSGPED